MKVLCYCDFGCSTGFAKVAENIIKGVSAKTPKSWHFDIIGVNYYGDKVEIDEKITLYSCMERAINKNDIYGRDSILRFAKEGIYDLLFILNDLSVIAPIYPHLKLLKKQCRERGNNIKFMFYFPVDSPPHPWHIVAQDVFNPGQKAGLELFDELITYTTYGKQQIVSIIKKYSLVNYFQMKEAIKVIPHGTDPDIHYMEDREEVTKFRREFFKVPDDTVLIGQVNRNSTRKDVATSLQAYKLALDRLKEQGYDISKVRYYLHMNASDPFGYNLYSTCGALGLDGSNFLLTDPSFNENYGVTKQYLNLIYNSLDLFFTTTTAEGWGLTILEAMACRVPVLAPVHTAIGEVTKNGVLILPINEPGRGAPLRECLFTHDGEYVRYRCDPKSTAGRLVDAILTISKREKKEWLAMAQSHAQSYKWSDIVQSWASLFRQLEFKEQTKLKVIR